MLIMAGASWNFIFLPFLSNEQGQNALLYQHARVFYLSVDAIVGNSYLIQDIGNICSRRSVTIYK